MRIRSVKPEFWKDERMIDLPRDARLVYIALWCEADDEGRFRARMDYLHGSLFPCDPGQWFDEAYRVLLDSKRVIEYEADGLHYAYIPRFKDHQKPNKPTPSKLPPPPQGCTTTVVLPKPSVPTTTPLPPVAERRGEEGSRRRRGEEGVQGEDAPPASPPVPVACRPSMKQTEKEPGAAYLDTKSPPNGLDNPDRVRRAFYLLWEKKYEVPYAQEPAKDRAWALALLKQHKAMGIQVPWLEWAPKIIAGYLDLDDDDLVKKDRHTMNHLTRKLNAIRANIGGAS